MDNNTGQLVDDPTPGQSNPPNILQQALQAITNLILPTHDELITLLRTPTPVKVVKMFTVGAGGNIGGSVTMPDLSQIVYTAPMSSEAWLHRISISSPEHGPATPIVAPAEILLFGSNGEIVLMVPENASTSQVAPVQFIEGRLSAPHLSPGESLTISGDGLTAGNHIRIDLQFSLVQGITEFTPKTMSPTDLTATNALS